VTYREDIASQKCRCVHGGCLWCGEPADHEVSMHIVSLISLRHLPHQT